MGVYVSSYNLSKDKFIVKLLRSLIPMLIPPSEVILIHHLQRRKLVKLLALHIFVILSNTDFQQE